MFRTSKMPRSSDREFPARIARRAQLASFLEGEA
jgi:hypothetical protein